jgi:hypothetical protein
VKWDRQAIEQTLAGLSNRIFLMNNVHDDAPLVFETRWAMSYLRGPLTRNQIKLLMYPVRNKAAGSPAVTSTNAANIAPLPPTVRPPVNANLTNMARTRPVLPPKVPQYFVPVRSSQPAGCSLFYQPSLIGAGTIHFTDLKIGVNLLQDVFYLEEVTEGPVSINWNTSAEINVKLNDLEQIPREPAQYGSLPAIAMKAESYAYWSKDFVNWLSLNKKIDLWKSPSLKEFSRVNESEGDFRVRLQQKAREQRDEATEKLRQKYAPKFAALQEQMRRSQASVQREKEQAQQQKVQTALSFGATLLGGFLGRKVVSSSSISRAKSTFSGVSRSMKEANDIERAQDTVAAIQQRLQQLDADFKAETAELAAKNDPLTEQLESFPVRPSKTAISVQILALGWLPLWQSPEGKLTQAW